MNTNIATPTTVSAESSKETSRFPLRNYSLKELKRFNHEVYGEVNGQHYFELSDLIGRLLEYNSRVSLWVRKRDTARTPYHLCMMFSWLLALANRLYIELHEEVARSLQTGLAVDASLHELQLLFASRHPDATAESQGLCLNEKIAALVAALGKYRSTHEKSHFNYAKRKMAESAEAILVMAEMLQVELHREFESCFGNGCSTCHRAPCGCGFRGDDKVV